MGMARPSSLRRERDRSLSHRRLPRAAADDRAILCYLTRAESRPTDSPAPKLFEGAARKFKLSAGASDQPAPSRSAVVSVRASFGLSRQSRTLGAGANEGGGRSVVSPAAAVAEDSYRLAALSHESRNLRKSSRVSLSVASCARAAHSAAFCRQYPIFCHMTVPPLEPAARPSSPARSLENEFAACPSMLSREEALSSSEQVGKAKRAHA